ncbi:DUF6221 family protein [Streptosporangium canum]|uniref:DUF6221 family protein n=1 Tax=Streptosporangium canum TaxID=324952 RepID=UPI0033AC1A9D
MSDLVAFLRARLDEDEQAAQAGAQLHEDEPADPSYAGGVADLEAAGWEPGAARRFNDYVARFDPARTLREVEAKRRILAMHGDDAGECSTCGRNSYEENPGAHLRDEPEMIDVWRPAAWPCATLRLLALPYADHDDYEEDWRP